MPPDEQLDALTRANLDELLEALGLARPGRARAFVGRLCRPPAARFARQLITYDRLVGRRGLRVGAAWAITRLADRLEVTGLEHLPENGPLLVVSNHPGVSDTLALFASLPRPDLRILAAERPFWAGLPCTSRQLIFFPPDGHGYLGLARRVIAHLKAGGAALVFPRGRIEPDPAVRSGAVESLAGWSDSIGLFVRRAPGAVVVPTIVSGVLSSAALHNPLTRLRRHPEDRERLAAMLQFLSSGYRAPLVRVAFGPPLDRAALLARGDNPRAITEEIVQHVRRLIEVSAPRAAVTRA